MKTVKKLFEKYREVLMYLIFGVLTTAVNWVVYFPLYNLAQLSAVVCTVISWAVAVIFAFLTNKPFVFQSNDWSRKTVLTEFTAFLGCRIGSGALDAVMMLLCVDILGWNGNLMKIVGSVLVIIINYIGSKLLFNTGRK